MPQRLHVRVSVDVIATGATDYPGRRGRAVRSVAVDAGHPQRAPPGLNSDEVPEEIGDIDVRLRRLEGVADKLQAILREGMDLLRSIPTDGEPPAAETTGYQCYPLRSRPGDPTAEGFFASGVSRGPSP